MSRSPSPSHFATDGQAVSVSWCRAPSGAHDQIFVNCLTATVLFCSGGLSGSWSHYVASAQTKLKTRLSLLRVCLLGRSDDGVTDTVSLPSNVRVCRTVWLPLTASYSWLSADIPQYGQFLRYSEHASYHSECSWKVVSTVLLRASIVTSN
jgi:hypothetical protein